MTMTRIRLKAIIPSADFRKSEHTIFRDFAKSRKYPGPLKKGEGFLFLSKTGNQLLWFFKEPTSITSFKDVERSIVDSRRWRVTGGTWHPFMLADYAVEAGIELVGIKRFEEIFDERRGRKR